MSERTDAVRCAWLAFAAGLMIITTTGCFKPWRVIRQAAPNPFLGGTDFKVAPVGYQGLRVGDLTEAHHLTKKDTDQRNSWEEDKQAMARNFTNELVGQARHLRFHEAGKYIIYPHVTFIEPGFYAMVASVPSEVQMTIAIKDAQGAVLDEIAVSVQVPASLYKPSVGQRLREAALRLGQIMARYLDERTRPQ
jgi:hypothetical protein